MRPPAHLNLMDEKVTDKDKYRDELKSIAGILLKMNGTQKYYLRFHFLL